MFRKTVKYIGLGLAVVIVIVLLFISFSIVPIDYSPITEKEYYQRMMNRIDSIQVVVKNPKNGWRVGYAKANITPAEPMHLAGIGLGRTYQKVHDSIYARVVYFNNGSEQVVVVSLDMLIVPPAVVEALSLLVENSCFRMTEFYFTATHSHSSIGGWANNFAGELYGGPYHQELVDKIALSILECSKEAKAGAKSATLFYHSIPVSGLLYNRLAGDQGRLDSLIRVVRVIRSDSTKLIMGSFSGHATSISKKAGILSRDYPGVFVDRLEQSGYSFAMFMAGAVGSHGCKAPVNGLARMNYLGDSLVSSILRQSFFRPVTDTALTVWKVPLALGEPQFRISDHWRVRPWLFNAAFEPSPVFLSALKLGNLVMLGAPCDYSGELVPTLDSIGLKFGVETIVTSFNGGYIGYVTLDEHYSIDHYETHMMSWYGPGYGGYMTQCLSKLLHRCGELQ